MKNRTICWVLALCAVFAPRPAEAEPFTVTIPLATSGAFFAIPYGPDFTAEGAGIRFTNETGSAVVSFTGVDTMITVTNSTTTVTLGRFDVVGDAGFRFPVNLANPELAIVGFFFGATFGSYSDGLRWAWGPGGSSTLHQQGPWDFGALTDEWAPYDAINFSVNAPPLELNGSTLLTADVGLVPEPSTMLLLGSGLVAAFARRRRGVRS